ncbi:hypothetical protein [Asanoa hainanensis]|uniref:hypothetical protein n=1 Tax=Asanoa hainanensis TaxID=560556 RepID=UPI000B7838B5|nr:hypothetical protein [Asanoa hainanensis]
MDIDEHPLALEARALVAEDGLAFLVSRDGDAHRVDFVGPAGAVVWPRFMHGPDPLLALLGAEQRYLAEERGRGTVRGHGYLDKARERVRRWEVSRG